MITLVLILSNPSTALDFLTVRTGAPVTHPLLRKITSSQFLTSFQPYPAMRGSSLTTVHYAAQRSLRMFQVGLKGLGACLHVTKFVLLATAIVGQERFFYFRYPPWTCFDPTSDTIFITCKLPMMLIQSKSEPFSWLCDSNPAAPMAHPPRNAWIHLRMLILLLLYLVTRVYLVKTIPNSYCMTIRLHSNIRITKKNVNKTGMVSPVFFCILPCWTNNEFIYFSRRRNFNNFTFINANRRSGRPIYSVSLSRSPM